MAYNQRRIRIAVVAALSLILLLCVFSAAYVFVFAARQPRVVRVLEAAGHEVEVYGFALGGEPETDQEIELLGISRGAELGSLGELAPDLSNLEMINIGPGGYSDCRPLEAYSDQLAGIALTDSPIVDLTFLQKMTQLQNISLTSIRATSIPSLADLKNLQFLHIEEVPITDLRCIVNLNLEYVVLNSTMVTDLSALATLPQLQGLTVENNPAVDLAPLAKGISLNTLRIQNVPLRRCDALSNLKQLTEVDIWDVPLQEFPSIKNSAIRKLTLVRTAIRDLQNVAELSQLETLNIGDTHVSDLTPLSTLPALQRLYLQKTDVVDLQPLANLNELIDLCLTETNVRDITPLFKLKKLLFLQVSANQVPAAQLQKLKSILPACSITLD